MIYSSSIRSLRFPSWRLPRSVHSELGVQILPRTALQTQLGCVYLWHYPNVFVCGFLLLLYPEVSHIHYR